MTLFLAVMAVLLASALCSGTEAALFSVPITRVRQAVEAGSAAARTLLTIRENMNRPIATIVIFNNVANIVGSIVVGGIAAQQLGDRWLGLFSGGLTFLVILFAEIIPKTLGERYAERIAPLVAAPVLALSKLLFPVLWLLEILTKPLSSGGDVYTTDEAEIRLLARLGHQEGVIEKDESEMVQKVFELNDRTARELMTPRTVLDTLPAVLTLDQAREKIFASTHSRLPVTGRDKDDVLGFVLMDRLYKALLTGEGDRPVTDYLLPIQRVEEDTPADDLLQLFRKSRQHIALVCDPFGATRGIVTLEDVIEVLAGNIMDETDRVADLQEKARQNAQNRLKPLEDKGPAA